MACTGTCTWTFSGGIWVSKDNCGGGCVCVDAISTDSSSPYHDPTDLVETRYVTIGRRDPLDTQVLALITVLDDEKPAKPISDIKAYLLSGKTISKFIMADALMTFRLNYLNTLPDKGGPPSKADLDANWNSSASSLISKALVDIAGGKTAIILPCSPPQ